MHPGRLRKSRQLTGSNALRNRVLWFRGFGAVRVVSQEKCVKKTWERNLKAFSIPNIRTTKNLDHFGWYLNISCIYIIIYSVKVLVMMKSVEKSIVCKTSWWFQPI